jgi:hypothetical protein
MVVLELGNEIYEWTGQSIVLLEDYFKITSEQPLYIKEIFSDSELQGVVLLGNLDILVDSVVYTKDHGAFGDTTQFLGTGLVVFGFKISDIESSIREAVMSFDELIKINQEASQILKKAKSNLEDESTNIQFDDDPDMKYIIFGKRDFLLISSNKQFVLIHKKQLSIRKGDDSLVQIDKNDGIAIANKDRILRIGCPSSESAFSFLGELGVNIASKVLESLIWE